MDNRASRSTRAGRRGPWALLLVLALTAVIAGCTPAGQQTTPAGDRHTLVVGATLEPASMDAFHNSAASIPQVLLYNVYETLVKVDSDGKLKPLLAQGWEVSPDRLTYTFHLNPAAKFASGAALDATAVKTGFEKLKADTKLTETLRAQAAIVASVEAPEASTVVFTLTRPSLMWLYDMSSTLGMVVDPTFTGDLATATAGSGPYTLQKLNKGTSVVLGKSPSYWGTPGRFDEVTFRYIADPNAQNAAMLSGEIDVVSNLQAPESLAQFSDTSRFSVIRGTTNGEVVLGLNHQTKALQDLRVRQALTMAIDRTALRDTVWNGEGTLIGSMAVPTDPWYTDLSGTNPYDPARARELLADAGYAEGLTLRLRVPTTAYATKSAKFVASQLRDVGVTATIEELDFNRWLAEVFTPDDAGKSNYDMTIVAHVEARDLGKFANPDYYWHYADPEFVRLFTEADESGTADQVAGMQSAVKFLADDAAAIWLFALPNLVITDAGITGIPQNATTLSFDLTTIASA